MGLYYDGFFDAALETQVRAALPTTGSASRAISMAMSFPDELFYLQNKGEGELTVDASMFPREPEEAGAHEREREDHRQRRRGRESDPHVRQRGRDVGQDRRGRRRQTTLLRLLRSASSAGSPRSTCSRSRSRQPTIPASSPTGSSTPASSAMCSCSSSTRSTTRDRAPTCRLLSRPPRPEAPDRRPAPGRDSTSTSRRGRRPRATRSCCRRASPARSRSSRSSTTTTPV